MLGHYRNSDGISDVPVSVATPLPVAVISGGAAIAPKGYSQIATGAAAVGLGSIPSGATQAIIVPEGADVRWRDDGTNPTATVGMPQSQNQPYTFAGDLAALKFITQSGTGKINVAFYG